MEEAVNYKKINKKVKIILRVNECDERKNTNHINQIFIQNINFADQVVFVSEWLKNLYVNKGVSTFNINVIRSAAESKIFYPVSNNIDFSRPLEIVTHHWSANKNKGFNIYKLLDSYLKIPEIKKNFSFNFIGNKPNFFYFKNTKYTKPKHGTELADLLRKNHIYITGTINEPAGMHFIEGMSCGLPILYIKSGGTTEYCSNYGIDYNEGNLIERLFKIKDNYKSYYQSVSKFQYTDKLMNTSYIELFKKTLINV